MFHPGVLLRAKEGHMIGALIINVISLIIVTGEVLGELFPETMGIPFFKHYCQL